MMNLFFIHILLALSTTTNTVLQRRSTTTPTTTTTSRGNRTKRKDKSEPTTIWFIDGNNLMGHKGTPRDRDIIANKISKITSPQTKAVILVYDGWYGAKTTDVIQMNDDDSLFTRINLQAGITADEYILHEIQNIFHKSSKPGCSSSKQQQQLKKPKKMNDHMVHLHDIHVDIDLIPKTKQPRIQVVTADRALRRTVLRVKPIVRGTVHPVKFWRKYLPRLCGYKLFAYKQQQQQQKLLLQEQSNDDNMNDFDHDDDDDEYDDNSSTDDFDDEEEEEVDDDDDDE